MPGLKPNDVIDLAVLLLGRDGGHGVGEAIGRIQAMATPVFDPCADLIAERVDRLRAAGLVELCGGEGPLPLRRITTTGAGEDHAIAIGSRAGARGCGAGRLCYVLRLSLKELLPPRERQALLAPMLWAAERGPAGDRDDGPAGAVGAWLRAHAGPTRNPRPQHAD